MRLFWEFSTSDVEVVTRTVEERVRLGRRFVLSRLENNVSGPVPQPDQAELWRALSMCLLSSQQRSGPGSPISQLLYQDPFPLSLTLCREAPDVFAYVQTTLKQIGGIRFTIKLPGQFTQNLAHLDHEGGWQTLLDWRDKLIAIRSEPPDPLHYPVEIQAAQHVSDVLVGFGPKQARNFWQTLGLMRYSFVLDSRIARWLRKNVGFPRGLLVSDGLGDENFYLLISDILRDLCVQAGVLPCVFDAAIFDTFDEDDWEVERPL